MMPISTSRRDTLYYAKWKGGYTIMLCAYARTDDKSHKAFTLFFSSVNLLG